MSTDPGESSPLTIAVHVDRLCDRFETAWAGSERPRIEAYLEAPDGPNASLAFRELLALELALRRAAGEHPTGDEYRTRFPNFVVELAAAFTEPDRTDEEARGGDSSWSTDLANEPTSPTALSSPKPANWPTLDGYEILSELGRGGMGVVYKALDTRLKRPVALKTILARELATPESLARFQAEAETVARLQHPNVVQVYAVGEQRGIPYFAMEFVAGGSLARKLDGTPWPPVVAARLMEVLLCRRSGASPRDHPPRPEASQRPARRRRDSQGGRLRSGQKPVRRLRPDGNRRDPGLAELHVARASGGKAKPDRSRSRRLRARRDLLRAARGSTTVQSVERAGDSGSSEARRTGGAFEVGAGPSPRRRDDRAEVSAQGRIGTICHSRGPRGRPEALRVG